MTLGKYIKKLADKLDPIKQFDREKAAENARKARINKQPEVVMGLGARYSNGRYGFVHWFGRRKRGQKSESGKMLPLTRTDQWQ